MWLNVCGTVVGSTWNLCRSCMDTVNCGGDRNQLQQWELFFSKVTESNERDRAAKMETCWFEGLLDCWLWELRNIMIMEGHEHVPSPLSQLREILDCANKKILIAHPESKRCELPPGNPELATDFQRCSTSRSIIGASAFCFPPRSRLHQLLLYTAQRLWLLLHRTWSTFQEITTSKQQLGLA